MGETASSERLTAFVSTVVAVAILAAGVTAHQKSVPQTSDINRAAADLRFQFEMGFRHDTRERDSRLARLDSVMDAWEGSTQSEADRRALSTWLSEAGARSLPGALQELPDNPVFSAVQQPIEQTVQKVNVPVEKKSPSVVKTPDKAEPNEAKQPDLASVRASRLAAESTEKPITPTPVDPLEEQMIELRQPRSVDPGLPLAAEARPQSAPLPGIFKTPKATGEPQLAAVSTPQKAVAREIADEAAVVRVNLTELAARIAGYHDGLEEVELLFLRMDEPNLDLISEQVDRLEEMTSDYSFVRLYYDSLSEMEREHVVPPRSMQSMLAEVQGQLKRYEEGSDGDFLRSADGATNDKVSVLRTRLKEIGSRISR